MTSIQLVSTRGEVHGGDIQRGATSHGDLGLGRSGGTAACGAVLACRAPLEAFNSHDVKPMEGIVIMVWAFASLRSRRRSCTALSLSYAMIHMII